MPKALDTHSYRPDIDGLRAIAVLAVLAFHGFPDAVPGGFVGVDIFFVISGYLITRIILDGLEQGTFTFRDFYSRRVRRIFPALALVLAACIAVAWWLLLPAAFRRLGAHVSAGAGFVANLLLWTESGYFDTAAEFKPLLHLWSLGIEEQYYLVWPLLLFLLRRHVRRILWMVLLIAVGSFALNVWVVNRDASAAFYLPPTRFWELMIGSVLAYMHVYRPQHLFANGGRLSGLLAVGGALLLAAALALLNEERVFPGWWALLPTFGAALLIAAGPGTWVNRKILSDPRIVFIGLISYPLYLWHWPLLTYARIYFDEEPSLSARLVALALSFLLAWLTYEFVEKRVRHAKRPEVRRRTVAVLAAAVTVLAVYGLLAYDGRMRSRSAAIPHLAAISEAYSDWDFIGDRVISGDSERSVLFIGDSHMQQYLPRLERVAEERRAPVRTVMFKTMPGCAPVPGIERIGRGCIRFVEDAFALAHTPQVEIVVIGASWTGFAYRTDYYKPDDPEHVPLKFFTPETAWVQQGFEKLVRDLVAHGKKVVFVLSSPRGEAFDPKEMVRRDGFRFEVTIARTAIPREEATQDRVIVDQWLRNLAGQLGITLVDPADTLCSDSMCRTVDEAWNPLFKDQSHLRASVIRNRFDALDRFIYEYPVPAQTHPQASIHPVSGNGAEPQVRHNAQTNH